MAMAVAVAVDFGPPHDPSSDTSVQPLQTNFSDLPFVQKRYKETTGLVLRRSGMGENPMGQRGNNL